MTISEWFPGLEVGIWIDGSAAKEYDLGPDEDDAPRTVTKYIEAASGLAFEVLFRCDEDFEYAASDLGVYTYIDGTFLEGRVLKAHSVGPRIMRVSGTRTFDEETGVWTSRPFMFSALSIDDGDIGHITPQRKEQIQSVGLIDIRICRVKHKGIKTTPSSTKPSMIGLGAVPEKALKGNAISHNTVFGEAVVVGPVVTADLDRIDTVENPLYTFKFRYRSISALKAMCIVPRSPSPEPLEARARRDPESLTREELLELQRLRNNEDAVQSRIKQESKRARSWSTISDSQHQSSPSTVVPTPRKRPRPSSDGAVEVIDLCDD